MLSLSKKLETLELKSGSEASDELGVPASCKPRGLDFANETIGFLAACSFSSEYPGASPEFELTLKFLKMKF
ncbi:unnamed protein product [Moneuplotes crassus]|uniref:Uncharacterized protein n=1 Tax=Euplotes crassus TaxID=5936 RepID=A0AAD1X6F7_EUPCR|nr:unnamed protein product [Moneuplotes crassus]